MLFKNVMVYDPDKVVSSPTTLEELGRRLNVLIAKAASTDKVTINPETDMEFVLQPHASASDFRYIWFEIKSGQQLRLDVESLRKLKTDFLDVLNITEGVPPPPNDQPLIWL